ncbi:hypothetical protein [Solidesulfovibrio magneticus]|nr:hypothetical protein [Solidesulfovibrio magneticus]
MLPFFRPKNDKDIGDKLVGKQKKYRLARNGSAVAVTGTLLAYYRRDVLPDGLMPPSGGRVELFAVIRTQAGRFFCYYIVTYPETEDIAGRQEYAHVCADFEAVRAFLGAMAYPGKAKFVPALLAAAQHTLEILAGGGKVKKAAKAVATVAPEAESVAGEPAGEPEGASAADAAADETPSPQAAEAAQAPAPAAGVGTAGETEAGDDEDVSAALARLVARARADIAKEAEAQKRSAAAQVDADMAEGGLAVAAPAGGGKRPTVPADADLVEMVRGDAAPAKADTRPAAQADVALSEKASAVDAPAEGENPTAAAQAYSEPVAPSSAAAAAIQEPASPDAPQAPAGDHAAGRLVSVADMLADAPFAGGKKSKKASKCV